MLKVRSQRVTEMMRGIRRMIEEGDGKRRIRRLFEDFAKFENEMDG